MASQLVIERSWNGDWVPLPPQRAGVCVGEPARIGMVIGTYAAVPYVHLQLESRRRSYPHVPVLVHDDGSHRKAELAAMCRAYGCDFESNCTRQPAQLGDLSCFVGGLLSAQSRQREILVKVSRRWIFLVDWTDSLLRLAYESQYATFCSYTTTFDMGFRSECVGMAVSLWSGPLFMDEAIGRLAVGDSVFMEGYMHEFARRFERLNCDRAGAGDRDTCSLPVATAMRCGI